MNRQALKTQALENVCSCFYYELTNAMDTIDDDDLRRIVNIGWWSHIEQELNEPQGIDELYRELSECPSISGYASLEQSRASKVNKPIKEKE